jgi:hypothetical protein
MIGSLSSALSMQMVSWLLQQPREDSTWVQIARQGSDQRAPERRNHLAADSISQCESAGQCEDITGFGC